MHRPSRGSGSDVVLQFDANQNNYDTASLQQHLQNCPRPARDGPPFAPKCRRVGIPTVR